MSSVHYKFKATLEYKTLTFDGLHIGVDELKKAICDKENIRTESFDLLLMNAHTKREYTAGELVPRNSSVVVQRIPRENAQKLPKVQDTSTSGIVQRGGGFQPVQSYINPEEFSKMSEEQRIAHIKQVSTEKYSAANYQRRTGGIMTGPPPPTYMCNRCGQPGHWYKNCPLVNTKRTTGIPMEELMETSRDDPLAMLHPSGKYVKSIMHYQARLQRKHEPFPGQPDDAGNSPYSTGEEEVAVPEQYRCNLCKGLLRDAVLAACCGHSFCAECYQQQLLAHPTERCPGPDCTQQISSDSLIPNKSLRAAIQKYRNEVRTVGGAESATTASTEQQQSSGGVNKPNVLTDTQSLLHKLMPSLAYAQAKRELATAGRSPTDSVASTRNATPPIKPQISSLANPNFPFLSRPPPAIPQQQRPKVSVPPSLLQMQQQPKPAPLLPDFSTPPPPIPQQHPQPQQQQSHFPSAPAAAQNGSVPQPSSSDFGDVWQTFLRMKDSSEQQQQGQAKTQPPPVPVTTAGMQVQMQPSPAIDQQPAKLPPLPNTTSNSQPTKPMAPLQLVLPPGAEQPTTPAIAPPGIESSSSAATALFESIGRTAVSSTDSVPAPLARTMVMSAAHQAAIRTLGPNAPPSEITDVWLTFLHMKDNQKHEKRHHSEQHRSISPDRRTPSPSHTHSDRYIRRQTFRGSGSPRRKWGPPLNTSFNRPHPHLHRSSGEFRPPAAVSNEGERRKSYNEHESRSEREEKVRRSRKEEESDEERHRKRRKLSEEDRERKDRKEEKLKKKLEEKQEKAKKKSEQMEEKKARKTTEEREKKRADEMKEEEPRDMEEKEEEKRAMEMKEAEKKKAMEMEDAQKRMAEEMKQLEQKKLEQKKAKERAEEMKKKWQEMKMKEETKQEKRKGTDEIGKEENKKAEGMEQEETMAEGAEPKEKKKSDAKVKKRKKDKKEPVVERERSKRKHKKAKKEKRKKDSKKEERAEKEAPEEGKPSSSKHQHKRKERNSSDGTPQEEKEQKHHHHHKKAKKSKRKKSRREGRRSGDETDD